MLNKNLIYQSLDILTIINSWIDSLPQKRGGKALLAAAAGCTSGFLSQVFSGSQQLSLEQGEKMALAMGFGDREVDYFLLLVQRARAGSSTLRARLDRQIEMAQTAGLDIKPRLAGREVSEELRVRYYSAWYYAATHLMTDIEFFQEKSQSRISKALNVGPKLIGDVLEHLEQGGLIQRSGTGYRFLSSQLFLPKESPFIYRHHHNWRIRCQSALDQPAANDFHYTSVISIAEKDTPLVREILIQAVEKIRVVVKDSAPADQLYAYTLDLFKVGM